MMYIFVHCNDSCSWFLNLRREVQAGDACGPRPGLRWIEEQKKRYQFTIIALACCFHPIALAKPLSYPARQDHIQSSLQQVYYRPSRSRRAGSPGKRGGCRDGRNHMAIPRPPDSSRIFRIAPMLRFLALSSMTFLQELCRMP